MSWWWNGWDALDTERNGIKLPKHYELGNDWYPWDGIENLRGNDLMCRIKISDACCLMEIPKNAFYGCYNVREVHLPSGITKLGNNCFYGCKSLENLFLPSSIEEIGSKAFSTSGLVGIRIPSQVTKIQTEVFSDCRHLVHVELNDNITHINYCAFDRCIALRNIHLPRSLQQIGMYAFSDCGLEQIQLPNHVSIDKKAFQGCAFLHLIILPPVIGNIGYMVFMNCPRICEVWIPGPTTLKPQLKEPETLVATEQQLLIELCRNDDKINGFHSIGIGWEGLYEWGSDGVLYDDKTLQKNPNQITCLFSFLTRNNHRIFKIGLLQRQRNTKRKIFSN